MPIPDVKWKTGLSSFNQNIGPWTVPAGKNATKLRSNTFFFPSTQNSISPFRA